MLNKWYRLKEDCVNYYAEYASTSRMDYDFIESHLTRPFKVKELDGFGKLTHVVKIIAPNWFGDIEVSIKIADIYEFFEEVEGWIEGGVYQLINRPGFVNSSKINIRIDEVINTKVFKVLKTSWGGRCDKIAFIDGSGIYNASLISSELKFFKMLDTANDSPDMAVVPEIVSSIDKAIKAIPELEEPVKLPKIGPIPTIELTIKTREEAWAAIEMLKGLF